MQLQSSNLLSISFHRMRAEDWHVLKEAILAIENEIIESPELKEDEDSYSEIFTHPDTIAFAAYSGDTLVGFAAGTPSECVLKHFVDEGGKVQHYFNLAGHGSLYLCTLEIIPSMQGKGIGTRLLNMIIDEAASRGYASLTGHFRASTAARMMKKKAPELSLTCSDYFGSGEDFVFYRMLLN